MARFRIVVAAVIAIVAMIVVLQNTQSVQTRLLFVTLTMPAAVLLFVTLVVGFVLGLIAAAWLNRRPAKEPPADLSE